MHLDALQAVLLLQTEIVRNYPCKHCNAVNGQRPRLSCPKLFMSLLESSNSLVINRSPCSSGDRLADRCTGGHCSSGTSHYFSK